MSKRLLPTSGRVVLTPLKDRPESSTIVMPIASKKGVMIGKVVETCPEEACRVGDVYAFDDAVANLVVVDRTDYYIVERCNLLAQLKEA